MDAKEKKASIFAVRLISVLYPIRLTPEGRAEANDFAFSAHPYRYLNRTGFAVVVLLGAVYWAQDAGDTVWKWILMIPAGLVAMLFGGVIRSTIDHIRRQKNE